MFVLGHLGIGSRLLFSLRTRLPAGWLYLGCLLPDLIDKPLFYVPLLVMHQQLPLITGTRTFGHTGLFLLAWLLLLAAILYLPNPAGDLRRRFFDALYLPLGVLAARGMYEEIVPRLRSLRARRLIPFSYVAVAAIGSAFLLLAPLAVAGQPQYSVTRAEYDGLNWLGSQPSGRVLAMPGVGLYVPAYSSDTVYVGHYDETFDYLKKTQIAYDNLTGKSDIEQFDAKNGIRYVVWTVDLETPPPAVLGPPAYDTPNFKIWKLF